MHDSVREFIAQNAHLLTHPVLEVGSLDVNGSVRDLFPHPSLAVGIDIVPGPGVDIVYDGVTIPLQPDGSQWGSVVCCECFEHVADPVHMAAELVRVCRPGGVILLTARGPGFALHNPPDRFRFLQGTLSELLDRHGVRCLEWSDWQAPGAFVRGVKPA